MHPVCTLLISSFLPSKLFCFCKVIFLDPPKDPLKHGRQGALKGTDLRGHAGPKTQILSENHRFSQKITSSPGKHSIFGVRALQKTEHLFEKSLRKPQLQVRPFSSVLLSAALSSVVNPNHLQTPTRPDAA